MAEKIQVRYTIVPTPLQSAIGKVYHKYLLYTDRNGKQHGLRAGPTPGGGGGSKDAMSEPQDPNAETPYGRVLFQDAPFDPYFIDYPASADDLSEVVAEGEDLSETWKRLQSSFHDIESFGYRYSPRGVNSNTIVDDTLAFGGLRPTRRDGSAGNDTWEDERGRLLGIIDTPGLQQLPSPPDDSPADAGASGDRDMVHPMRGKSRLDADALLRGLRGMGDRDFAEATRGDRWRRIWSR